ncbi:predicted protein [Phaeodactylum tricornutum CCAP 1055/1]|jgi:glutamate dehydrogenase|uniref:Glutamate/phenylalanine/leucine/valine/L-tryptophan dehydrogenase C-terminal domain-containing protein n=2 Tax=Phaeodactylum tricornutum TaxID=2850 RepID=B7FWY4_PHATC|nr:predicted protein [Phaeodactylum tricornutum CCAP 1055/1]EEC49283.1 predicted protein [Phaeodactylum tricornutum CCAP 1055/1]|eukprot:XP_002179460.1 predicted protein [Phaeodactylum tricornutum CCAP 1055/1]
MLRSSRIISAFGRQHFMHASIAPLRSMSPLTLVVARAISTGMQTRNFSKKTSRDESIIPGVRSEYGSLGDLPSPSKAAAPWQAEHNIDVQRVTQKAMVYELCQSQTRTIEEVVPWFLENMPTSYFRQVPERFRMDHIKAIAAVKDANMDLYLNLQSHLPDGRQVLTFIRPGTQSGTLVKMVQELPWRQSAADYVPLSRIHVFSTRDDAMSLNMFVYGTKPPGSLVHETGASIIDYAEQVNDGSIVDDRGELKPSPVFERGAMIEYLQNCSENYINIGVNDPRRFLNQRLLFAQVSGSEGTAVQIDPVDTENGGHYWVDMAVANSLPQVALEHLSRLLYVHDFDVTRARLDVIPDGKNGNITMLRMLVSPCNKSPVLPETLDLLALELKRVKWLDPATITLVFEKYPHMSVAIGETITALCSLMHPIMTKYNAVAYSKANIYETLTSERFIPHAEAIADMFLDRFNPHNPLSNADFDNRCDTILKAVDTDVEDTVATELLEKMIDVVKHTLRTNVYLSDRYALALRLDPRIMVPPGGENKELPYGVFFTHGRRFNGFHVRFRDISRGGMRLVTPRSPEQFALESARHYDECYGLAFAQQLKNKDIPEGGSKAVCLINTNGMSDSGKNFVMRKSVKAFTDSILDLIVETDETRKNIVDLFGKKEVLYLGPDEQVIPDDINWVIKRAGMRGYQTPAAFMSSKPRAGINHKVYGVTSEGVNVYLDVALRHTLGINPKDAPFTVKITGGPDGDVAGNEMKIMMREYGDNARIVGIADAFGCAEDPRGLDHGELERLVTGTMSIVHFDASKLSADGVLHTCDTEAGTKARNTMHNRLVTDAFVPCGGRPGTIDSTNYKQFLQTDGSPSSKLIVEGANLFITTEARQALFDEAGVVIVKDSSANKGGVITSSYEICAAMLCTEEEFFDNKTQIVSEVLDKLRGLAKLEAELLFREFENFGGSLPEVSQIISNSINAATDALSVALDTLSEEERESLLPLFRAHLPKTLADLSFEHVHDRVPEQYIKNAISSCLASKIVYKEGTRFISSQKPDKLAAIALKYIHKEKEVADLMESLSSSEFPENEKKKILYLLERGGARTALEAL